MKLLLASVTLAAAAAAQSVPRDGFELHYRTVGKGPLIVLLSGGPGFNVDYMQPVADKLSEAFTCVLLEQRGTGRSRPEKLTPEIMKLTNVVEDIDALRIHLKLEKITLVGHSWGGMLAMAYAAAHPALVDRLVLIGSGGMNMGFASYFNHNIGMRLTPSDLKAVHEAPSAIENIRARLPGYFYSREKALAYAAQMPADSYHSDASAPLSVDLVSHYNVREALKQVDRPVLIVQGRQDPIGESTAYEIHLALKNSSLKLIDECGHFPWVEQPDQFFKAVREFLSGY